jgi:hypothetical protein
MKNITITLDDDLARRARVAAAEKELSLSKFVSKLVEREIGTRRTTQLEALERFLRAPNFPGIAADLPSREELYGEREDELLRRYQRSGIRNRSRATGKAGARSGFAERGHQKPYARPKPTKPK